MPDKYPAGKNEVDVTFSDAEMEWIRAYAKAHGISEQEAASQLASDAMKRKFRERTGMTRAKVFTFKKH